MQKQNKTKINTSTYARIDLKAPTNLSIKNLNVRFVVRVGWRLPIDNDTDAY